MTYAEKLKHPKWQRKRLEIMERDNFTCQHCGSTEATLNVHHKTYIWNNDPWDYPDSNFITLCEDCHQNEEYEKESFKELTAVLLRDGATYGDLSQIIIGLAGEVNGWTFTERARWASFAASQPDLLQYIKEAADNNSKGFLDGLTPKDNLPF